MALSRVKWWVSSNVKLVFWMKERRGVNSSPSMR